MNFIQSSNFVKLRHQYCKIVHYFIINNMGNLSKLKTNKAGKYIGQHIIHMQYTMLKPIVNIITMNLN